MSAPPTPTDAAALERALTALGLPGRVEPRERLAVLRPAGAGDALADRALRDEAIRLAALHGFTHLAVELPAPPAPRPPARAALPRP